MLHNVKTPKATAADEIKMATKNLETAINNAKVANINNEQNRETKAIEKLNEMLSKINNKYGDFTWTLQDRFRLLQRRSPSVSAVPKGHFPAVAASDDNFVLHVPLPLEQAPHRRATWVQDCFC